MATNYPGSIDSLTNPSAGDALTSPSHSAQHANANDAIEAIETELGVNPSGSDATVAARLSAIEAGTNLATGAVTSAKIADGTIATGDIADGAVTPAKLATSGRFVFPTGAANGFGFTSGASHLSGTGSPEGVVTAAPGSTWLQTDATTDVKGWIRWVKATGTGNTGWVAGPEADTGTRSLAAVSLSNGWAVQYSNLYIRRNGRTVTFGGILSNATATADTIYTLPSGFRPFLYAWHVGYTADATKFTRMNIGTDGVFDAWSYNTHAAGTFIYFQVTYLTNDPWPSSLPGTV